MTHPATDGEEGLPQWEVLQRRKRDASLVQAMYRNSAEFRARLMAAWKKQVKGSHYEKG